MFDDHPDEILKKSFKENVRMIARSFSPFVNSVEHWMTGARAAHGFTLSGIRNKIPI